MNRAYNMAPIRQQSLILMAHHLASMRHDGHYKDGYDLPEFSLYLTSGSS